MARSDGRVFYGFDMYDSNGNRVVSGADENPDALCREYKENGWDIARLEVTDCSNGGR